MSFYSFAEHPGFFAGKHPVKADSVISSGALVAIDASGNAQDAASSVTGHVAGRAEDAADNSGGAAGDVEVLVKRGCYALQLDDTNAPTKAHIGRIVYATAPDTVASVGTCRAGKLIGFDEAGFAIVDTNYAEKHVAVTLGSTNGSAAAAADLAALKTVTESVLDDVHAVKAALVTLGILV
jgi:hypothetical protein